MVEKKKNIFGAILGGAVATGASIFIPRSSSNNTNVKFVPSGSPTVSGSPSSSSSSPPSDSTAPSEDPSLPPLLPPSVSDSTAPSLGSSSPPSTYWSSLNWNQEGQDINRESSGDYVGSAVALSANGMIMVVGAPESDDDSPGHVNIFVREGQGSSWEQRGDRQSK